MDSLTQAVLGAAVADATLGSRLGRKAALWGLILGTLPDLDILAAPWLGPAEYLRWHRGWSHGLLAMLLAPPALTWLLRRIHGSVLSWRRGLLATGLIYLTHVLIDCFTVYGTGLFEPFSDAWVEWNLLFIIDPLYTLPLLAATIAALAWPWTERWRPWLTGMALTCSSLYVAWAGIAKLVIEDRFAEQMAASGIVADRWQSMATPLNTLMWRCLAEGQRDGVPGFWVGYASLLDADATVAWRWLPRRADLLAGRFAGEGVRTVHWFSRGYWLARRLPDGRVIVADLRFGETTLADADIEAVAQPWIFCWSVGPDGEEIVSVPTRYPEGASPLGRVWQRMLGQRFRWE